MFAVLINHIESNAGRELALIMQAFLMSADIVLISKRYRHPGTPVWSVNAPTAFDSECDKQRERPGCFFFTLCYKNRVFSTAHCLAPMRRQPTKTAKTSYRTSTRCASIRQPEHAAGKLLLPLPCASNSASGCSGNSILSAPSKSRIQASTSSPASVSIVAVPYVSPLIPFPGWAGTCATHSLISPDGFIFFISFAHLISGWADITHP